MHFLQRCVCVHTKKKTQPPTSCISGCSAELFLLSAELHWISGIVVVRSGSPASQEECVQKKKETETEKAFKGGDRSVSGEDRKRHRLYFLWKILLHTWAELYDELLASNLKMHWPALTSAQWQTPSLFVWFIKSQIFKLLLFCNEGCRTMCLLPEEKKKIATHTGVWTLETVHDVDEFVGIFKCVTTLWIIWISIQLQTWH